MRRWVSAVACLVAASSGAGATCADPSAFVLSTVSIVRHFDDQEKQSPPDVLGIRGTGWFLSSRMLVTAAHVAEAMHLSGTDWKEIELRDRDNKKSASVRVARVAGSHAEKIAVLELSAPIAGAATLPIRRVPLDQDERVASLAYPGGVLRFAGGRFVQYGEDDNFAGTALLEMYDGNDRLVLDHGASGAPVLDCEGRVVAVVSIAITQTISLLASSIRVSTAWQTPNVVSVPIQVLEKDFARLN
jgi:hypothetical protein